MRVSGRTGAIAWWTGRARQLWRHLTGRVTAADRARLAHWLTPAQQRLFASMHRADQRHGLDVVELLRAAGHDDPELLLAGLFHDAAKGPGVRARHRVAWSLVERHGERLERLFGRVHGFANAFDRLRHHADRSADLALAAGCSQRTAELIRYQAVPVDPVGGEALRLADEAS